MNAYLPYFLSPYIEIFYKKKSVEKKVFYWGIFKQTKRIAKFSLSFTYTLSLESIVCYTFEFFHKNERFVKLEFEDLYSKQEHSYHARNDYKRNRGKLFLFNAFPYYRNSYHYRKHNKCSWVE